MSLCVHHTLLCVPKNKYLSDFVGMVHSTCMILCNPGISAITVSILWLYWFDINISLGHGTLLWTCVLVDSMALMLILGHHLSSFRTVLVNKYTTCIPWRCCSSVCFLHFYATCIPRQWHGSSSVLPAQLCYLYSEAMVRIFLCASCTTLLLVFCSNG